MSDKLKKASNVNMYNIEKWFKSSLTVILDDVRQTRKGYIFRFILQQSLVVYLEEPTGIGKLSELTKILYNTQT